MRILLALFGYAKVPLFAVQLAEKTLYRWEKNPHDPAVAEALRTLIDWLRSCRLLQR